MERKGGRGGVVVGGGSDSSNVPQNSSHGRKNHHEVTLVGTVNPTLTCQAENCASLQRLLSSDFLLVLGKHVSLQRLLSSDFYSS